MSWSGVSLLYTPGDVDPGDVAARHIAVEFTFDRSGVAMESVDYGPPFLPDDVAGWAEKVVLAIHGKYPDLAITQRSAPGDALSLELSEKDGLVVHIAAGCITIWPWNDIHGVPPFEDYWIFLAWLGHELGCIAFEFEESRLIDLGLNEREAYDEYHWFGPDPSTTRS